MPDMNAQVNHYLTPPPNAFWNWSEDGEAIVWADNNHTITFRAQLAAILRRHLSKGLPPLGSVLLVFAACRDSWVEAQLWLKTKSTLTVWLGEEFRQLDNVHGLPAELRFGTVAKTELTAMLFEASSHRTSIDVAAAVVEALSLGLGAEFVRRRLRNPPTVHQLLEDLKPLREGLRRFDEETFKLRLETGLEQPPAPAEVDEPLATRIRKLFDRLQNDEEFSGMVRLARNPLAMVHLPRPLIQPDEIPVGGVSDIANRGELDRLLISELAQDDEMLMLRVAMNEAMYLRRETPPRNPPRTRLVLLDTGLRMWGIPRVMAASVAMSFAAMSAGPVDLRVLRREGHDFLPADLSTREGLIEHLKVLDPHIHPGAALANLPRWIEQDSHETDVILVTSDSVLADREFQKFLNEFGGPIEFIATVSRAGWFQLLQRTMHGTRLLREAHLDIEQAFAPTAKPVLPLVDPNVSPDLPAILALHSFPLRLSHNIVPRQTWTVRHHGVLAVTNDRRLMHWDDPKLGARQITDQLASRRLLWSQTRAEQGCTHFVVGNASKPKLQLGIVDVEQGHCELLPLEASQSLVHAVCEHAGVLFLVHRDQIEVCGISSGEVIQAMTAPRGFRWSHGRYFRSGREWKALSYDGITPRFEDVKTKTVTPLALFDVEGIQGPVELGRLESLRFGIAMLDRTVPLLDLASPGGIIRISPGGERVILSHWPRGKTWAENVVIDVLNGTVKTITGDPHAAVDPEIWNLVRPRCYRNQIRAIGAHADGRLVLLTKSDDCQWFGYDRAVLRYRLLLLPRIRDRVKPLRTFQPIPGPPGVGYQLQMAEWSDGSRAFLDSRGLLHLKSSDPKIPQASFVLTEENLPGWCANGEMWGEEYYTGMKPRSLPHESSKDIVSRFVSRLR